MDKNKFWLFLLSLIGISALWHTAIAGYKYSAYYRLDSESAPTSMSWSVEEQSSSAYFLKAFYEFSVDKKTYEGSTEFLNDTYLNSQTAKLGSEKMALLPWKVWYDKNNPNKSSLQKDFPFKQCIYAIILWGIFLYFVFLKISFKL